MHIRRYFALAMLPVLWAGVVRADSYKIDPVHSSAIFRILHSKVSYLYGRITAPEGTVVIDDSDPTKDSFDVSLKAANIDTGVAARDKHLKSPDFFSAEEFPTLTFKSTAVKSAGDKKLEVTGDMTIHGQTKSITVDMDQTGTADTGRMGVRTGLETTFTIKRSDFGMTKMLEGVGDDVRITVSLEAAKQ